MKSMISHQDQKSGEPVFYGSPTVGERGQISIPAEARSDLGIEPGDKLLVMRHPCHDALVLFKLEAARECLDSFDKLLRQVEDQAQE